MIKQYRKKPVTIEAVQWTGENISEICEFTHKKKSDIFWIGHLCIETHDGVHLASIGDYIIKGVKGEFYPCKPDVFTQTYEDAEKQPTVDAVNVVRCKDCKHWLKDVPGCTDFVGRCELANYMIGAVGYCVYGEMETNKMNTPCPYFEEDEK